MNKNIIPEPILIDFFKMLGPKLPKHLHISGVEIIDDFQSVGPSYLFKLKIDEEVKKILEIKSNNTGWLRFRSKIASKMSENLKNNINDDYNLLSIYVFTEKMSKFLDEMKKYFNINNVTTIYS